MVVVKIILAIILFIIGVLIATGIMLAAQEQLKKENK